MQVKPLSIANFIFALAVWALSVIVLLQLSFHSSTIKAMPMQYVGLNVGATGLPGVTLDSGFTLNYYANLWGGCAFIPDLMIGGAVAQEAELDCDAHTSEDCDEPYSSDKEEKSERRSCQMYQLQTTFYVLVSLGFAFATLYLIASLAALFKPIPPVLIASIVFSFFTWLWLLVFWTLYFTQGWVDPNTVGKLANDPVTITGNPGGTTNGGTASEFKMGSGFMAAIAGCWCATPPPAAPPCAPLRLPPPLPPLPLATPPGHTLARRLAFVAMIISIVPFVVAGKEEGGDGSAPRSANNVELKGVGP